MNGATCVGPVLDAQKRARLCGKPATVPRMIDGNTLPMCAECAAAPPGGRTVGALAAALTGMRELTREIRLLAEDATLPGGERLHARKYLRKMICRRLRELDARINAIEPTKPAD